MSPDDEREGLATGVSPARESLAPWRRHPGEDAWHQLSTEARRALLEPLVLARDAGRASPLHAQTSEARRGELATAGFLVRLRTPTGAQFGLDVAALPFVNWLVELRELELLSEAPALEEHLDALFPEPSEALRLAQSAAAHGSLSPRLPDPHAFLATHALSPAWPAWALPRRGHGERLLLELVEKSGGRAPVRTLDRLLPRVAPEELDRTRERLASRLVLFHALDPATLELELGFLAPVRAGLRPQAPAAPEPAKRLEPLANAPGSSFERAVFQSDLGALLLELARSPAQIKTSNQLYEKARVRLEGALEPLPGWLEAVGYHSRVRRLEAALRTAQLRKLTKTRDKLLSLSEKGREHLALPRAERLATFPEALPWQPGRHDEHFYGVPATSVVISGPGSRPHAAPPSAPPSEQDKLALREAVARVFAELPAGRFFELDAFARAACSGGRAPLLRGSEPERVLATLGLRLVPSDRRELEEASRQLLRHLIAGPLVHVGGVALAPLDSPLDPSLDRRGDPRGRAWAFALTAVGRVFLGLDRALAPETAPVPGDAIVQPSFEVVLFGSEPAALLDLLPFAEPAGGGAGDAARTLQITRARVQGAIGAGLTAEQILATLARLSRTGVPDNVARTIRDWARSVRLARVAPETVLSFPDAETLERARLALGEKARPLAHALSVPGHTAADLRRRLEKLGIVLEL